MYKINVYKQQNANKHERNHTKQAKAELRQAELATEKVNKAKLHNNEVLMNKENIP